MNQLIFNKILDEYENKNWHLLLKKYNHWFEKNAESGFLNSILEKTLVESLQHNDFKKYDFVLLAIQTLKINFTKKDKHFELLFQIADSITEGFENSQYQDKRLWLLHQLMDVCFHNHDELELVAQKNPELIPRVVGKIGKVKYVVEKYGPEMYYATYKAVELLWYMPKEVAQNLMQEVYLKHFDKRIIKKTEEFIEYIK